MLKHGECVTMSIYVHLNTDLLSRCDDMIIFYLKNKIIGKEKYEESIITFIDTPRHNF